MPDLSVRCIALSRHDRPCVRVSLPDAPFPVCVEHAAELLRFLHETMAEDAPTVQAMREEEVRAATIPFENLLPGRGTAVVYYVSVGGHIKVGYSSDLRQRLRFYPPDSRLLAYEYGDKTLERQRLIQFSGDLRARFEWFAPSAKLIAHIEELQRLFTAEFQLAVFGCVDGRSVLVDS